ncbi:lipopolysaccharide assembly protein LapB [Ramlibacter sp. RBP-2]|uniref:Lipopolysaccharide assembly protein B n=1 Tax=Ramlibacter lithotrophicus TaxID=2606681 RepID=A0A7X6DEZ5_9BURK|nr:lipopolysaccharide assembly protein LapB [Ramlibacter lithotrophicus]NKE65967.1 lipopolysaccharide assembly protein LapB [Ramlibacter lithotrophicus]
MDFDLSWVLWGLPIAFVLGWVASRLDLRQLRIENRQAPKAYFKGLNFLLNEQQDQAIDAFIEAVQKDPDTSELHFALGNLFRRRGEYERAVRVHEHLLSRGDLSRAERQRAQHGLALDFLKAGLLDRAEDALRKLEGTPYEGQALPALLAIYERTRDWVQASEVARKLDASGHGNFAGRQAHYLCEQAAGAPPGEAERLLREAMEIAPEAPRPGLEVAALQRRAGDEAAALESLLRVARRAPAAMGLLARPLAEAAQACGRQREALEVLEASYEQSPSLDVLEGIVQMQRDADAARGWYVRHLEREPSLVAATKWLAGEKLEHEQFHPRVQNALDHATKPLTRYRCAACGFEAKQHFWQCPGCQAWDSYPARRVEEL